MRIPRSGAAVLPCRPPSAGSAPSASVCPETGWRCPRGPGSVRKQARVQLTVTVAKTATMHCCCLLLRYTLAHLSEVDVLRSCEVEALLLVLVLQKTLREPISHLHVAAVVLLRVKGGVGQHGGRLLDMSRVQQRRVTGKLLRLEGGKDNHSFTF